MHKIRFRSPTLLAALFIIAFHGTGHSQTFTDINANLDPAFGNVGGGQAAWGDYDGDGDLDLAYMGSGAAGVRITRLYRNDGGAFTIVNAGLPNVSGGGLAWGDYDNDGDLDLFLMGTDAQFNAISDVYRYDGNNTFTALGLTLPLTSGSVFWADFDNDGDLDIFIAGHHLYRNDGNSFTAMNIGLPQVFGADADWGDYDNDGDLDLTVVGLAGAGGTSIVYRNDGAGSSADEWSFTDTNAGLLDVQEGSLASGDFDSDGYLDLAITGRAASANVTQIYRNNRNGTFTAAASLEGVRYGDAEWGDFDNDGDLDLAITGRTNSFTNIMRIYENNNGGFSDANIPLSGLSTSSVAWGDFDFDGDLDLFAMGSPDGFTASTRIFNNNTSTVNNTPATPDRLNSGRTAGAMTLVWGQASDPETLPAGLTYNLRVGSTPGGSEVVAPMSLAGGFHQIAGKGNVQHNRLWTIENIDSSKTYYWSVQTIDNSFLGSAFAPEQIVQPKLIIDSSFVEINFSFQGLAASDAELGDIDGDLDVAITGGAGNQGFTHIYRSDNIGGVRSFAQVGGNIMAVHSGALAWGDFDNDNDLDLLVAGLNSGLQAQTGLFRNDSGAFSQVTATLPNVTAGSADWADVDHDGDLDLLLTGSVSSGFISEIYENINRNGLFFGIQAGLIEQALGDALFFDFNNDQGLEILITGQTENGIRITNLYEIDATGAYRNVNPSIPGLWFSAVDVGDYDNDGDLDFAVSGARADEIPTPQDAQPFTFIYRNDISTGGGINQIGAVLKQVYRCAMDWGDYDADGDLDLLITGFDGTQYHTRIYHNDGNDDFQEVDSQLEAVINGAVEWGDYNNDSRLDILMTGQTSTTLPITKIYENIRQEANNAPSPPASGFSANVQGTSDTLNWGTGSDPQTPTNGLTYNLRAGTTPGGNDVVSSTSGILGRNKLARRGNVEQNRQWTINNLPAGETIYWSVQTIDNNYSTSAFSTEQSFQTLQDFNFTNLQLNLPGLSEGDVEWGDYDNDGDLDFIAFGADELVNYRTRIYRNDDGSFTELNPGLPQLRNGSADWGDFDKDSDLDLALTGNIAGGRHTGIWRNNNGFFSLDTTLRHVYHSDIAWGDLNNDGNLDVVFSGLIGSDPLTTLSSVFLNAGAQGFSMFPTIVSKDANIKLGSSYLGSLSLMDFNRDGNLDIFLTGHGEADLDVDANLYSNQGLLYLTEPEYNIDRVFRLVFNSDLLIGLGSSASAWGDYNHDGYPDLIYCGEGSDFQIHTFLYRNDGGETFTRLETNLPAVKEGDLTWADFDNDGNLDILITGLDSDGNPVSSLFTSTTDPSNFQEVENFTPVYKSAAAAGDYDKDGDLDLVILGKEGPLNSQVSLIVYRNDATKLNTPPQTPVGLTARLSNKGMALHWAPSNDNETDQQALTYNLRVGSAPGLADIIKPMAVHQTGAGNNGFLMKPEFGNMGHNTRWMPPDDRRMTGHTYYCSVQAIDQGFVSSQFSNEFVLRTKREPVVRFAGTAFGNYSFDVGDFDNDNDLDLLVLEQTRLFENQGAGQFSGIDLPFESDAGTSRWQDFDHNGHLDIMFSGRSGNSQDQKYVDIFLGDGTGNFSPLVENLGPPFYSPGLWNDYNRDTGLDVILSASNGFQGAEVALFRFDGEGIFTRIKLSNNFSNQASWGDFDNDGDSDLSVLNEGVFRNDGNDTFTRIYTDVPGGEGIWGDYDNDGDLDLFTFGDGATVFKNLGNNVFSDVRLSFGQESSRLRWADFDNDGDIDLLTNEERFSSEEPFAHRIPAHPIIYRNDGGNRFKRLNPALIGENAGWIDYNGDGVLDIVSFSRDSVFIYETIGVENSNNQPQPPSGLRTTVNGDYVTFEWQSGSDAETPAATLSYNLRIGTALGLDNVVSSLSFPDGRRKVLRPGNIDLARRVEYKLWPNQNFYWSVQSVDQGFMGSPFARDQNFSTGSQSTQVRFVNLSADPSLDDLDVYLGGFGGNSLTKTGLQVSNHTPILDDLNFLEGSALLPVPADSSVSLLIAPGNSAGSADAVAQFDSLRFGAGQIYVITISGVSEPAGFAANPDGRDIALNLHIRDVTRDSVALDTNQVGIYFVHGVTDAPAVDVIITTFGTTPLPLGTFSFGETSDIIPMLAGETEILITDPNTGQRLAGFVQDLRSFAGSVMPVLFAGFLDPPANQNGPDATIAPIAPNGDVITFIADERRTEIPKQFQLLPNYPNPFNPSTTISYSLPQAAQVELTIFDILGRKVSALLNVKQSAGNYRVVFDASGLASGVYFYRLRAEHFVQTRKMLLLR